MYMVYLPTFTIKIDQMWVYILYIECLGRQSVNIFAVDVSEIWLSPAGMASDKLPQHHGAVEMAVVFL